MTAFHQQTITLTGADPFPHLPQYISSLHLWLKSPATQNKVTVPNKLLPGALPVRGRPESLLKLNSNSGDSSAPSHPRAVILLNRYILHNKVLWQRNGVWKMLWIIMVWLNASSNSIISHAKLFKFTKGFIEIFFNFDRDESSLVKKKGISKWYSV